jgi:pimeloyl-ACP methyl ester carboxylesterase
MKYLLFSFMLIFLMWSNIIAQNYEKVVVNAKDSTSGYYLAVNPASNTINCVLFLLDGFGGSPESILVESKLPSIAYANGILTVAASMGQKIYADSAVIGKLNLLLQDVVQRYHVNRDKFVLGGFSAGGTIALRYVELCKENPLKYPINPKAVFTVDSPVDIIDLWSYFQEQIEKNYSDVAVSEATYVSALMQQEHGTPTTNLQQYQWLTPFNHNKKEAGNEKYLKDIPVRVYHDVDIVWRLQNRMQSGYDANFLVASELILRLMVMKNTRAEFVKGNTGYRSNGMRHPHAWSIVNEIECIQWIKKIISN